MQEQERFQLGEFWLAKRIDGRSPYWQISWYDPGRRKIRQRSTGTTDFELAQELLARHYIARGERKREPAERVYLEHVLMRYYENHAKALPSSHFALYAIDHWNRFWKESTVAAVTEERLQEFTSELAKQLKPATVNRVLGVGRAALIRALRRKELAESPFVRLVQVPKQRLYRATQADLARLLNATDQLPWIRKWVIGSMVTLGRPQAVLELSRPQMDFAMRRIDLNPPGRLQTDKERPLVPMTETALQWMSGEWTGLWITYGGRPLKSIRMGFERARERAGLGPQFTPYTLRRTLSTELRRRGVPPWEIAGFLGHTVQEYAVTEGYAEYAPDYLAQAARALDAYCAELQPLLDFELVHSTCIPQESAQSGKLESNQVGRLGLEPRTNTLKGSELPSNISHLKSRG